MYFWAKRLECFKISSRSLCNDIPTPLELFLLLESQIFS